jgi:thiosulfate/3-mercaptopyruvate sulfurtransferase
MKTIVSAEELNENLSNPDWLIFDCRFSLADDSLGFDHYRKEHIQGAYYADLNKDLSGDIIPGKTGRHPLPEIEAWKQWVSDQQITPARQVVAYDDIGGAFAARLWWLLRWIGHDKVAVLDGNWQYWLDNCYPTTASIPEKPEPAPTTNAHLTRKSLTRQVSVDEIPGGNFVLLDARDEPRYRGEIEPIDPVAGHIPGALCSPFTENLSNEGCFKSRTELHNRFSNLLSEKNDRLPVCYCGSGVTATHNILAMVHAGLEEPALYPGSWSEWILDSERPVET